MKKDHNKNERRGIGGGFQDHGRVTRRARSSDHRVMSKITIRRISRGVFSQKGFDDRGCYGSACGDDCCRYGCDVDRESYGLIVANGSVVEALTGRPVGDCFRGGWSGDPEFLGGDSIESAVREDGYCAFHERGGKGCVLYRLAEERGLPRRIIPSICRLYPITWGYGDLFVTDDMEPGCNCAAPDNRTQKSVFETQRREIEDILDLDGAGYFD